MSGHSNVITSVAISPNGKIIASGSDDNSIKLWNTTTGQPIRILQEHPKEVDRKEVTSIAFSPDGKTLASGSVDQSVKIWRVSP